MKDIEQQLKNYGSTLEPSAAAEDRVFETVLARLSDTERSNYQKRTMTGFLSKFSKPALLGGMLTVAVLVFMAPAVFLPSSSPSRLSPALPSSTTNLSFGETEKAYEETVDYEAAPDLFDGGVGYRDANLQVPLAEYDEDADTPESQRAKRLYAALTLATGDVRSAYTYLTGITSEFGGYITNSSLNGTSKLYGSIHLRIPSDRFYDALEQIRSQGYEITSESLNVSDRQNQLSALEETEKQLQEEIADLQEQIKTATEADKPALQTRLIQLESRLDVNQDEISDIAADTDLATIELTLVESVQFDLLGSLQESLETALLFWGSVAGWLLIPLCAVSPLLVLFVVWVAKRKRRRN